MPNRRSWEEQYRNPYSGVHVPKDRPKVLGKPLFRSKPTTTAPRGHFKLVGLPEVATGLGQENLELRAASKAQYPELTVLERIFLRELFRRHWQIGRDFIMQESIAGGKQVPGG